MHPRRAAPPSLSTEQRTQNLHDRAEHQRSLVWLSHQRGEGPLVEAAGWFGPGSLTWRILREVAVMGAGPVAVVLELLHPAVAEGVRTHSRFLEDPLGRARRTLEVSHAWAFGSATEAVRASKRVFGLHAAVHGRVEAGVEGPWGGRDFRANQPDLLWWVFATLHVEARRVYEALVVPLSPSERAQWHVEGQRMAALAGLPPGVWPETPAALEARYAAVLEGDDLTATPASRQLFDALFGAPGGELDALWTAGFLPPRLRAAAGLPWGAAEARRHARMVQTVRRLLPLVPPAARFIPAWHEATLRVAQARGQRGTRTSRWVNRADLMLERWGWDLPGSVRAVAEDDPLMARVEALFSLEERRGHGGGGAPTTHA